MYKNSDNGKTKKKGSLICWILMFFIISGMGAFENRNVIEIPEPEKNYSVTVIDQTDKSVRLNSLTFDGKTFLTGRFGLSEVAVSFEKIKTIFFLKLKQNNHILAKVVLKKEKNVDISLKNKSFFLGVASFGNVKIKVKDIKKISFIK